MDGYNVVYASDENYIRLLAISISSLIRNNARSNIQFFVFDCGIEPESKNKIETIVELHNCCIKWIDLNTMLKQEWIETPVYSKAIYARLFIDRLPSSVHKILYLDSDTLINKSISELWKTDLVGKVIYGKKESKTFTDARSSELGYDFGDEYINSGVLLINLDKWRELEYSLKVTKYLDQNSGTLSFPDQDTINIVCREEINYNMSDKYNSNYIRGVNR